MAFFNKKTGEPVGKADGSPADAGEGTKPQVEIQAARRSPAEDKLMEAEGLAKARKKLLEEKELDILYLNKKVAEFETAKSEADLKRKAEADRYDRMLRRMEEAEKRPNPEEVVKERDSLRKQVSEAHRKIEEMTKEVEAAKNSSKTIIKKLNDSEHRFALLEATAAQMQYARDTVSKERNEALNKVAAMDEAIKNLETRIKDLPAPEARVS